MMQHRFAVGLVISLTFAAAAPAEMMRGVITHVDLDKKQLELEGRGKGARGVLVTFGLSDQTEVRFADQDGALSDLEAGRRVRIEYDGKDHFAEVIHVVGRRPAGAVASDVPPVPPVPTDGDGLTGVLRRVGYSDREVVLVGPGIKGPETETTVEVPAAARITIDGKEATLDDLKEGQSAVIQAEKKEGRLTATSLQVGAAVAAAPPEGRRARVIQKIRNVLQKADEVLQGIEEQDHNREPQP